MKKKVLIAMAIVVSIFISIKAFAELGVKDNILIILDSSYSMNDKLDNIRKIDIAKKSLNDVVSSIPANSNVGLRIYGHKTNFLMFGGCKASDLVVPIEPNSKSSIQDKLSTVKPTGLTPITYSLRQAVNSDLNGISGKKRIVLISDGGENCDMSPCDYVMEMSKKHPEITIDVIGFDIDDMDAIDQLKCTALVTNGKFYTAKNQDQLNNSLKDSFNVKTEVNGRILNKN